MSDSLIVVATGEGEERLSRVFSVCSQWRDEPPKWEGWKREDNNLILCRFCRGDFTEFPTSIKAGQAASIASAFLDKKLTNADWPNEPDIDGSLHRGWKVTHDDDTTVIEPFWMIYHK